MKGTLKFAVLAAMLLGLPLAGVLMAQLPASRYFEFPPRTLYIEHAPFSWIAFIFYSLFILAAVSPFLLHALRNRSPVPLKSPPANRFPWWGWCGVLLGLVFWILAWNRFPWFSNWQAHTFTPLWIAYILTINGFTYRRTGICLLLRQPLSFLLLFPASAGFWWFFEYLNRFVQNWSYPGVEFGPGEYFLYATLSFSTVLPAITGTREWLLSSAGSSGRCGISTASQSGCTTSLLYSGFTSSRCLSWGMRAISRSDWNALWWRSGCFEGEAEERRRA